MVLCLLAYWQKDKRSSKIRSWPVLAGWRCQMKKFRWYESEARKARWLRVKELPGAVAGFVKSLPDRGKHLMLTFRMFPHQARRSVTEIIRHPRGWAVGTFGGIVLACVFVLLLTSQFKTIQELQVGNGYKTVFTEGSLMISAAKTSDKTKGATFILPAPDGIRLETSCPFLKDKGTRDCHGERGFKVVGGDLIACGGCGSYYYRDKDSLKGGRP